MLSLRIAQRQQSYLQVSACLVHVIHSEPERWYTLCNLWTPDTRMHLIWKLSRMKCIMLLPWKSPCHDHGCCKGTTALSIGPEERLARQAAPPSTHALLTTVVKFVPSSWIALWDCYLKGFSQVSRGTMPSSSLYASLLDRTLLLVLCSLLGTLQQQQQYWAHRPPFAVAVACSISKQRYQQQCQQQPCKQAAQQIQVTARKPSIH